MIDEDARARAFPPRSWAISARMPRNRRAGLTSRLTDSAQEVAYRRRRRQSHGAHGADVPLLVHSRSTRTRAPRVGPATANSAGRQSAIRIPGSGRGRIRARRGAIDLAYRARRQDRRAIYITALKDGSSASASAKALASDNWARNGQGKDKGHDCRGIEATKDKQVRSRPWRPWANWAVIGFQGPEVMPAIDPARYKDRHARQALETITGWAPGQGSRRHAHYHDG